MIQRPGMATIAALLFPHLTLRDWLVYSYRKNQLLITISLDHKSRIQLLISACLALIRYMAMAESMHTGRWRTTFHQSYQLKTSSRSVNLLPVMLMPESWFAMIRVRCT